MLGVSYDWFFDVARSEVGRFNHLFTVIGSLRDRFTVRQRRLGRFVRAGGRGSENLHGRLLFDDALQHDSEA